MKGQCFYSHTSCLQSFAFAGGKSRLFFRDSCQSQAYNKQIQVDTLATIPQRVATSQSLKNSQDVFMTAMHTLYCCSLAKDSCLSLYWDKPDSLIMSLCNVVDGSSLILFFDLSSLWLSFQSQVTRSRLEFSLAYSKRAAFSNNQRMRPRLWQEEVWGLGIWGRVRFLDMI